jgi:hypothetical protein
MSWSHGLRARRGNTNAAITPGSATVPASGTNAGPGLIARKPGLRGEQGRRWLALGQGGSGRPGVLSGRSAPSRILQPDLTAEGDRGIDFRVGLEERVERCD